VFSSQLNEKLAGEHQKKKNGVTRDLPKAAQHENVPDAKGAERKRKEMNLTCTLTPVI
jgi:hypothetical protein